MNKLQRDILRRHGLVTIGILLLSVLFVVSYLLRVPDPNYTELIYVLICYTVLQSTLLFWVASGRSLKNKDPSLTLAFLILGITYISVGIYFVPENRDISLLFYLTAIPYGIFQLNWQRFLFLALYSMTLYLAVIFHHYLKDPRAWPLPQELTLATALLFCLLFFAVLGKEVTVLRSRYVRKNEELKVALKQIEELAITDELTGLYNRRFLQTTLASERAIAQREGSTFVLAFIDIDHFKAINDRHGHAVGDEVLVELAQLLRTSVREMDLVARFGGEEFVILLRDMTVDRAVQRMERIRKKVEGQTFSALGLPLTISAGLTEYRVPEPIDELILRADKLLYQAKEQGRNRVVSDPAPRQLSLAQDFS